MEKSCVYPYLFETAEEHARPAGEHSEAVVRPYVLGVEAQFGRREARGEVVEVTLLGRAERCWAYVVHALREGGERGLGVERQRLELTGAEQETEKRGQWRRVLEAGGQMQVEPARTPPIVPMPERALFRLLTPLRLRWEGDLLVPGRLGLAELTKAVLRRLALLSQQHTDQAWRFDHLALRQLAAEARIEESRLRWRDWSRYSSRQQTRVPLGGIVGEMVVDMRGLEPLWPYIWLGQWTHAGKGASVGLGRYEVSPI